MDQFPNRLTGKKVLPDGAFFFEYDYWVEEEGEVKSVINGSPMPPRTLERYLDS
jgi:hypothetical protein